MRKSGKQEKPREPEGLLKQIRHQSAPECQAFFLELVRQEQWESPLGSWQNNI